MSKTYEKWRELDINPFEIPFKKIKLCDITSYPPAGNDVVETKSIIENKIVDCFIKIERSKISDFVTESINLKILCNNKFYKKIPKVYEEGNYKNKNFLVISKIEGERLSDLFNDNDSLLEDKDSFLINYGAELGKIHNIPNKLFDIAKQRIINDYPKIETYNNFDTYIIKYIKYLEMNKPKISYDCFIHGDFHYANILWENKDISGVIDFEYSGTGFKEQDIAWAIVLRPNQMFLDNLKDIKCFLIGYTKLNNFNKELLKWCLINSYCHFYLMNINNVEYKNKLKNLLDIIMLYDFEIQ